jgi:hypothetical protein
MLDWINLEVAIEKSCPTGAAGTSAVGPWLCIDVKRQSPLMNHAGELIEALEYAGCADFNSVTFRSPM